MATTHVTHEQFTVKDENEQVLVIMRKRTFESFWMLDGRRERDEKMQELSIKGLGPVNELEDDRFIDFRSWPPE